MGYFLQNNYIQTNKNRIFSLSTDWFQLPMERKKEKQNRKQFGKLNHL